MFCGYTDSQKELTFSSDLEIPKKQLKASIIMPPKISLLSLVDDLSELGDEKTRLMQIRRLAKKLITPNVVNLEEIGRLLALLTEKEDELLKEFANGKRKGTKQKKRKGTKQKKRIMKAMKETLYDDGVGQKLSEMKLEDEASDPEL